MCQAGAVCITDHAPAPGNLGLIGTVPALMPVWQPQVWESEPRLSQADCMPGFLCHWAPGP